ncbi:MAG: muramidase [Syntrophomonadaceae bacterium]|nr:muramidase [Syntrophomonadaceae bacterium]
MKIDPSIPGNITEYAAQANIQAKSNKDFNQVLNNALKTKDEEKLMQACRELESVFLSKVMETMRASIPRSEFITRSFAEETFESMLYDEYAREISKNGSIGIAEMMYKQLSQK